MPYALKRRAKLLIPLGLVGESDKLGLNLYAHYGGNTFRGHGAYATGRFGATSSGHRLSQLGRQRRFVDTKGAESGRRGVADRAAALLFTH